MSVLMSESFNSPIHSNGWFIQKRVNWLSLWMGHWIIDSLDSFKRLIRSETGQLAVLMNGPLNHWLTRFIQTADSFRNGSIVCPYEWATESLTHSIHSNGWFVQKRVNWLSLWMGHWIIDSLDSFKRLIRSETGQLAVLMNGPLNHWLTRFIQKRRFAQKRNTAVCCSETHNSSAVALIATIFVSEIEQKQSVFWIKSVSHCNRADIVIQGNIMAV